MNNKYEFKDAFSDLLPLEIIITVIKNNTGWLAKYPNWHTYPINFQLQTLTN